MEGPPLRVIGEELAQFRGMKIHSVSGNAKIQIEILDGQKVLDVFCWGKNLFFQFPEFALKVHFLMFGSYRVNEERVGMIPRLAIDFTTRSLNFYNCSIKILSNSEVQMLVDEETDIMSDKWNLEKVVDLTTKVGEAYVCDVLLDQNIFTGVGNIIKNEALFMSKIHPSSIVGKIPRDKLEVLAKSARQFSKIFYEMVKKGGGIRAYQQVYGKRFCPKSEERVKVEKTGKTQRKSYFCASSQILYA